MFEKEMLDFMTFTRKANGEKDFVQSPTFVHIKRKLLHDTACQERSDCSTANTEVEHMRHVHQDQNATG